jgi:hypothetical protein
MRDYRRGSHPDLTRKGSLASNSPTSTRTDCRRAMGLVPAAQLHWPHFGPSTRRLGAAICCAPVSSVCPGPAAVHHLVPVAPPEVVPGPAGRHRVLRPRPGVPRPGPGHHHPPAVHHRRVLPVRHRRRPARTFPAAHVRRPRLDHESHATGLDHPKHDCQGSIGAIDRVPSFTVSVSACYWPGLFW